MISLTDRFLPERIDQYATQIHKVPKNNITWFEETFDGELAPEYYQGLLSGLQIGVVCLQATEDNTWWDQEKVLETLKQILAFTANHVKEKL